MPTNSSAWCGRFVLVLAPILALMLWPVQVAAQVTVRDQTEAAVTPTSLAQSLAGAGVAISNVTSAGALRSSGQFQGGAGIVGFDQGVILSSGWAREVIGPNISGETSFNLGIDGDPDLNALSGFQTFDRTVLEFDFIPQGPMLTFQYVFGSEEYNEFANTPFNDVFAFFVNGVNCAVVPSTGEPVSINTINGGNPLGVNPRNPALYRNNAPGATGGTIDTGVDGLTVVMTCTAAVQPNVGNHIKLAIADGADSVLDSYVFLRAQSFIVDSGRPGDFDADGKREITVFRPSTGTWFVRQSHTGYSVPTHLEYQWGLPGDQPLSGDFDGDGAADLVAFRPSAGHWLIRYSSNGYAIAGFGFYQWGLPGDMPIPADFDGDGKTDLVVYRPSAGEWYVRSSSTGYAGIGFYQWGLPGDVPIVADFDGDGRADLSVYRPASGFWYVRYSSTGYAASGSASYQWGLPGDVPLAADFDGDHKTDLTIYRPATGEWYIRYSTTAFSAYASYQWGLVGDLPLAGDFDGDGKTDLAVLRPATHDWYIRSSLTNYSVSAYKFYQWGLPQDVAVPIP